MDRERAETHLRLLAEAELRRAMTMPADSIPGRWNSAPLALVAQALSPRALSAPTLRMRSRPRRPGRRCTAPARCPRPPARDASGRHRRRAPWRVVPVGQLIKIPNDDLRRDLLLVAYVQSAGGARFIVAGPPFLPSAAADDVGVSYQIGWSGGHAAGQLLLRPDPPHQIRWLDLTMAAGEPATRIDLDPRVTVPHVTVTRTAYSPGELLLDAIAARILITAAPFSQDNPGQLTAASADLRAVIADGSGHIVAALHAAGLLPPDGPAPGQLAGLCARLGINGHGITAPPAADLPERWRSMLTPPAAASRRRRPRPTSWSAPWPSCPSWTAPRSRSWACITASVAP